MNLHDFFPECILSVEPNFPLSRKKKKCIFILEGFSLFHKQGGNTGSKVGMQLAEKAVLRIITSDS